MPEAGTTLTGKFEGFRLASTHRDSFPHLPRRAMKPTASRRAGRSATGRRKFRETLGELVRGRGIDFRVVLGVMVILGLMNAIAAQDQFRTWTDATGRFKVDAKLISQANGSVTLRRRDEQEIVLPFEKLSEPDREFLTANDEANPFRPVRPAMPAGPSSGPMRASTTESIVWNDVKILTLGIQDDLPIGAKVAPRDDQPRLTGQALPLAPTIDFFERPSGVAIDAAAATGVAVSVVARPGAETIPTTRVCVVRLASGAAKASPGHHSAGLLRTLGVARRRSTSARD